MPKGTVYPKRFIVVHAGVLMEKDSPSMFPVKGLFSTMEEATECAVEDTLDIGYTHLVLEAVKEVYIIDTPVEERRLDTPCKP